MPQVKSNIDITSMYRFITNVKKFYESYERMMGLLSDLEGDLSFFNDESEYILHELFDLEDAIAFPNSQNEKCYVYFILNKEKDRVKIGISSNPTNRAKQIQTSSGEEISILNTIEYPTRTDALDAEAFLHKEFSEHRRKPSKVAKSSEWFDAVIVPDLMRYYTTKENIQTIKNYRWEQMCKDMDKLDALYQRTQGGNK